MDMADRRPETVRREIEVERAALVDAVDALRDRIRHAAHPQVRLILLAPIAAATGFVVTGGIGASMRYLARRSRGR
jgi:hypothetical protein